MDWSQEKLLKGIPPKMNSPTDKVFWLYLITTTNDMEVEKCRLYADVIPSIKQICEHCGLILQVVELESHKFCHKSVKYALTHSRGHCVLALLGQKCGPVHLPSVINAKEFKILLKTGEKLFDEMKLCQETKSNMNQWNGFENLRETLDYMYKQYKKDQNSIPPEFLLQPDPLSMGKNDQTCVSTPLLSILNCLQKLAKEAYDQGSISQHCLFKYFHPALSIINQIGKDGSSRSHSAKVFALKRQFYGFDERSFQHLAIAQKYFNLKPEEGKMVWNDEFQDVVNDLESSSKWLSNAYRIKWCDEGINRCSEEYKKYMQSLLVDVSTEMTRLVKCLNNNDISLSSAPDDLSADIQHHSRLCDQICNQFCGRWETLSNIGEVLQLQSVQIVLYGKPGSGKTYICGKIVQLFSEVHGSACVKLFRFIGLSQTDRHLIHILRSLCKQLYRSLRQENKRNVELGSLSTIQQTLESFLTLLAELESPCLILLDGIDHLQSNDYVILSILKSLPSNVTCVLSTSSNLQKKTFMRSLKKAQHFQAFTQSIHKQSNNVITSLKNSTHGSPCFLAVPPFSPSASVITMDRVLKNTSRCLTAYQRDQIITASSKFQNALYVKLISTQACTWSSFNKTDESRVGKTNLETLEYLFDSLEKKFDKELLTKAMLFLTESKCGLSEVELTNIILQDTVIQVKFPGQHITEVPHLLQKLLFELQHLLTDKQVNHSRLLTWSHSEVKKFVERKYLGENLSRSDIHKTLATFWLNLTKFSFVSEEENTPVSSREKLDVPSKGERDPRVLDHIPFHVLHCVDEAWIRDIILSPRWILFKLEATSSASVSADFQMASEIHPCQGYKNIADAVCLSQMSKESKTFLMNLASHLQQSSLDYPKTVGILCQQILEWLSKQEANDYVLCIGPQSSSGPLLWQTTTECREVFVSTDTNELITITQNGFMLCYDVETMNIKRMKKLLPWPSFDAEDNIIIHKKDQDVLLLLVYRDSSLCVFDLISLDHVRTIPLIPNSSHVLSPCAKYISTESSDRLIIFSSNTKMVIFSSSSEPGSSQSHLMFSEDDTFEVFQDMLSHTDFGQLIAIRSLNLASKVVTQLVQLPVPLGFHVVACNVYGHAILIGIVASDSEHTSEVPARFLDQILTLHCYHLPTNTHTLDIKLSFVPVFLSCNKTGDAIVVGNQRTAVVYKIPSANIVCEIQDTGCKSAILGSEKVMFYSDSLVQVYSLKRGNLLCQWTSLGYPNDRYWLTDDNEFLVRHAAYSDMGRIQVWNLTDKITQEEAVLEPPFQCLTFCRPRGLLCGVTNRGHIATMDTSIKRFLWKMSSFKIHHPVDCLILSDDASLLIALGAKLSLVDLVNKKLLITRELLSPPNKGRFIDGCLSADKKIIVALEKGINKTSTIYLVKAESKTEAVIAYPCVPGTAVLRNTMVLFLPKRDGISDDSLNRDSLQLIDLYNVASVEDMSIGMALNQVSVICFSPDDSQMAVLAHCVSSENPKQVSLDVVVFNTTKYKIIRKYSKNLSQILDITKAFFLTYFIVIFTNCGVLTVDLLSGAFNELTSFVLNSPILSKDEQFAVALTEDKAVCLMYVDKRKVLLTLPVQMHTVGQFMASCQLDILLFFVKGMAHPAVFVANDSLRKIICPQSNTILPSYVGTSASQVFDTKTEPIDQFQYVSAVSRLLLSNSTNVGLDSSEKVNESNPSFLHSIEMSNDIISQQKEDPKIEPKAYFTKQSLSTDSNCNNSSSVKIRQLETVWKEYRPKYTARKSPSVSDSDSSSTSRSTSSGDTSHEAVNSGTYQKNPFTVARTARESLGESSQVHTNVKSDSNVTASRRSSAKTQHTSTEGSAICNYFVSSESENAYDAGVEDNTITENDSQLESSKYKSEIIRHKHDVNDARSFSDDTFVSTDSDETYFEEAQMNLKVKLPVAENNNSCNYFAPDETSSGKDMSTGNESDSLKQNAINPTAPLRNETRRNSKSCTLM